ncbi:MAG: site-specific DNA-methyltransferase [Peptostreptococcales bacterium]
MSIIKEIPEILRISREQYEKCITDFSEIPLRMEECITGPEGLTEKNNFLFHGDNMEVMRYLLNFKEMKNKIQLIYIDPPFFSNADYNISIKTLSKNIKILPIKHKVYRDTWDKGLTEYLVMLCTRLFLMKDLLNEKGSIFLHLDHHSVHYAKIFMDEIFGHNNFRNEIIWSYKSGGSSKKQFSRKHDTILFYTKSPQYTFHPLKEKSYNRGLKPYHFKGVEEYEDEKGWYTVVNMKDVWSIDMVGRTSGERVEYATQKPEALIKRMVEACSAEGDLCADFFGGSGTLAAVASKCGRRWITCDKSHIASLSTHKRLLETKSPYEYYSLWTEEVSGEKENDFDIHIEINQEDDQQVRVSLIGFKYNNDDSIPCHERYKEAIKTIMKEDSLELIAYWSIDPDYDHRVLTPTWYSSKSKGKMEKEALVKQKNKKDIAVRVVDIFGQVKLQILDTL